MSDAHSLVTISSLVAFFRDELTLALRTTGTETTEETEAYLVHLLDGFSTVNVDNVESLGFDKPAATILEEAMQAEGDRRIEIYRRLGDASLYNCGFFSAHLERRVGPNYYKRLGRSAYQSLGEMMTFKQPGGVFDSIFNELAAKFDGVVEAFRYVAKQRTAGHSLEHLLSNMHDGELDSATLLRAGLMTSKDTGLA